MRKKTAPRTRKHRKPSPSKKLGLIAREKNAQQSAKTKSALDNRFHRTAPPISCSVTTCQLMDAERLTKLARFITAMTFLLKAIAPSAAWA